MGVIRCQSLCRFEVLHEMFKGSPKLYPWFFLSFLCCLLTIWDKNDGLYLEISWLQKALIFFCDIRIEGHWVQMQIYWTSWTHHLPLLQAILLLVYNKSLITYWSLWLLKFALQWVWWVFFKQAKEQGSWQKYLLNHIRKKDSSLSPQSMILLNITYIKFLHYSEVIKYSWKCRISVFPLFFGEHLRYKSVHRCLSDPCALLLYVSFGIILMSEWTQLVTKTYTNPMLLHLFHLSFN